jgi:hypothetical protein
MSDEIFQLKIEAKHIKPNLWRRVLLTSTTTLLQLHEIIMILFGFEGYHLFEFHEMGDIDCSKTKLSKSLEHFIILNYTYDFGDCWEFKITLEKTLKKDNSTIYPCCIKSKGGMMLEDCGGEYGYKIITDWCRNKTKSSRRVLVDFYGDPEALEQYADFDPDRFDINEANVELMEQINRH